MSVSLPIVCESMNTFFQLDGFLIADLLIDRTETQRSIRVYA